MYIHPHQKQNITKNMENMHMAWHGGTRLSVISTLRKLRQEDHKFKASLGYRARPCLKIKTKQKKKAGQGTKDVAQW
jgi:hypothetical protein